MTVLLRIAAWVYTPINDSHPIGPLWLRAGLFVLGIGILAAGRLRRK